MPEFSLADILGAQAGAPGPVYEGGPTGNVTPADVMAAMARMPFPISMVPKAIGGMALPGDVAAGRTEADLANPEYTGRAFDLASTAVGVPGGAGGVGSGARLPPDVWILPRKTSAPPMEVLVNPTSKDVRGLAGGYPDARFRYLGDTEGNKFVWDADYGTHYDVFDALKLQGREGERRFISGENADFNLKDMTDILKKYGLAGMLGGPTMGSVLQSQSQSQSQPQQ